MMQEKSPPSPFAVEFRNVTKRFGAVVANRGLSFSIRRGEIHAVVGENGAGKSTAMKVLFGMESADEGSILVHGSSVRFRSSQDAMRARLGMVHQHFMLAGPYTALDNVILGAEHTGLLRPIRRSEAKRKLELLAERYGLQVPWERPVEELALGQAQRLEILKLLYRDAEILILDEPTAVLTPQEVDGFFENIRKLRSEGKTILLITHKMREVMNLSDAVTVFRQGSVVAARRTAETSAEELAELMVGRKLTSAVMGVGVSIASEQASDPATGMVLQIRNAKLCGFPRALRPLDLHVRAGEIVGIAGVEGNGQGPLIECLTRPASAQEHAVETLKIYGQDVRSKSWGEIRAMGVGCVPPDRHRDGLMLDRPVWENFILGPTFRTEFKSESRTIRKLPILNKRRSIERTRAAMEEFDVRPRDPLVAIRGLSGGNQQKLILAREFDSQPGFMVIAQPTRGVDVGAIEWIHAKMLDARARGVGILLISSELEEIFKLSDRMLVLYEGAWWGEYARREFQSKEKEIGQRMAGVSQTLGERS